MTGFPISRNPIVLKAVLVAAVGDLATTLDIPGIPFSSSTALSTYVQSKFSAPSLCNDDVGDDGNNDDGDDNGTKTATANVADTRTGVRKR